MVPGILDSAKFKMAAKSACLQRPQAFLHILKYVPDATYSQTEQF